MKINKCDRCGYIEDRKPEHAKTTKDLLIEAIQNLGEAVTYLAKPYPFELSKNGVEYYLCDDCQKKLRDWFENPNEDEDTETEEWNSYHGKKIRAPKGTFEKIYNDSEEEP